MIKIVDRYVGRVAVVGVLAVWVTLTLLMVMFTFLDELGDAETGVGLSSILYYVALRSVNSAYVVFPVSALLGAMIGVGGMAAGNELVAFRTAGVSRLRISGSVLGAILFLALGVMTMGEYVMPVAEQQARVFKEFRLSQGNVASGGSGMWIRDGNSFISIDRTVLYADEDLNDDNNEVTLHNVVQYNFDDDGRLQQVDRSALARHDGTNWVLLDRTATSVDAEGVERQFDREVFWDASFDPAILATKITRPRYMSVREIREQIDYLQLNGLDIRAYSSVMWNKMLYPLSVIALVLAGMPFLFGSARTQSMGLRIFVGMSLGGVFMIVSKTMQNFGEAYALPSPLSAALPSMLLALVVIVVLKRSV